MISIAKLSNSDRHELQAHFMALATEDRRLRFGGQVNDLTLCIYVEGLDFERDSIFGVLDDDLRIVAVAHLAHTGGLAELAISVLAAHRHHGIGAALFARALVRARIWKVRELSMHFLTENSSILRLAQKFGMNATSSLGETDATLALTPAGALNTINEVFEQRLALTNRALKVQTESAQRVAEMIASFDFGSTTEADKRPWD
jgi:GNAT superfamily N-acetyltransferase